MKFIDATISEGLFAELKKKYDVPTKNPKDEATANNLANRYDELVKSGKSLDDLPQQFALKLGLSKKKHVDKLPNQEQGDLKESKFIPYVIARFQNQRNQLDFVNVVQKTQNGYSYDLIFKSGRKQHFAKPYAWIENHLNAMGYVVKPRMERVREAEVQESTMMKSYVPSSMVHLVGVFPHKQDEKKVKVYQRHEAGYNYRLEYSDGKRRLVHKSLAEIKKRLADDGFDTSHHGLTEAEEQNVYEMLTEGRLDFLKTNNKGKIDISHDTSAGTAAWRRHKTPDAISDHVIDHLAQHADPSPNKVHTQWLVGQYKKQHIRLEDSPRMHQTLTQFDKVKHKMPEKDINKYKHVSDLEAAVAKHDPESDVSKSANKAIVTEGSKLVHDDEHISVHVPETRRAAQELGRQTNWCTAYGHPEKTARNSGLTNNMFEDYNEQGPLHVVTFKKHIHPAGTPHVGGMPKRAQFHFESSQFADEEDRMKEPKQWVKEHPELRKVKAFSDRSLYFNTKEDIDKKLDNYKKQPVSIMREIASADGPEDFL